MGRPMTVQFTVDSHLASIIRAGVLWFDGATVVEHDHRLDAPLAAAEAAVRMNPPAETTAVRTMYKRVGIDPHKLNEVLIESRCNVVVLLNQTRIPHSNLIDEPSQVNDAAEESFGTSRVGVIGHWSRTSLSGSIPCL